MRYMRDIDTGTRHQAGRRASYNGVSSRPGLSPFVLRHNERKVHNDMDGGIPGSQAAGHGANRKVYSKSLLAAAFLAWLEDTFQISPQD